MEIDPSWWKMMLGRVARATRNANDAEDYLHSAFLKMRDYGSRHTINDPAAFLVRTAVNIAIDDSRHRQVRNESGRPIDQMFEISDDRPLQTEVLIARQRLLNVQKGLERLPRRTREIFLMHRLGNLKYREIAAELGITVSAVEKHIAKAVLFLTKWTDGW